jgi:serine/threonine protein kinase
MGNACSCLTGLDHHQHDHHHHAVRYGDVPKYAGPCERLQQVQAVSMSGLQQKNSGSPRKGREAAPSLAIDQSDTQQLDEQQPHWHSPNAAEQQQQHQQYLQQAGGGVDAEQQQLEEEQEVPTVPFSWTKGELIGIGAFGRVYTALNNETGELVAVKQVSFAKDEALQGRVAEHIRALEAEVDVLKTLKHENIVRYLGTERTGDALHIFLEYVPGGSIASLLTRFGAFPEPVIRAYTAQLLRGLEYLHARGIMHRWVRSRAVGAWGSSRVHVLEAQQHPAVVGSS